MEPSDAVLPTPTPPTFTVVGHANLPGGQGSTDLWVHGTVVYTGTLDIGGGILGNTLWVWDVSDPATPVRVASVVVDARSVLDVKIRADGTLGLITQAGSNDRRDGVMLIDLSNPLQPSVISRTTTSEGVHNAWIEGDYAYLADNRSRGGLRVLDISDPANPRFVASYYGGSSHLHDVYLRDGFAFLSHWDAGLIILDVGNGVAGGSPTNPVEVGRVRTRGGKTHNAWYWPAAGYVFVGEERFVGDPSPPPGSEATHPGKVHVVDVSDMSNPVEVATFGVSGGSAHNFWLDEARGILYVAWHSGIGIRAIDVTGELRGGLELQGREVGRIEFSDGLTWAPQLHDGLVYVSDVNSGLWILRPEF